jgi:CRISPR-associated protein Csd1
MILQALNAYYQRKCADPDPAQRLPDFGFEQKEIPFVLELTTEGKLVQILDTRKPNEKKKLQASTYLVPQGIKRASNIASNFLWDTVEYALGVDTKGKPERVVDQHAAFKMRLESLPDEAKNDAGTKAIASFLAHLQVEELASHPAWSHALEANANVTFKLQGDIELICQRPALVHAAAHMAQDDDAPQGMCLVTGELSPVERLHSSIKGVWDAQSSGANIVSFNARAFESYGKTERQGENAPVSRAVAFGYTTALNHLLRKGSRQRVQIGDASTVFWAEKDTDFESLIPGLFTDDPDTGIDATKAVLESMHAGKWGGATPDTVMHVLGLSPNAARISVRFYHRMSLQELGTVIAQYFTDLEMVRAPHDSPYPSLYRLLTAVALQSKADNVPPNLGGAIVDAIFAGPDAAFPSLWLNAAVGRCRAEQNVNYLRACAIKACLNRQIRRTRLRAHPDSSPPEKEFLPMLDLANPHAAYRLGRLFATLERAQELASPGINATIRDRYYGAASSTPVAVFTTLLRLEKAHLKKLPEGQARWIEGLIGEILEPIQDFPKHLTLPDQGRFALGYYQQRQFFFTKKPADDNSNDSNSTNPGA